MSVLQEKLALMSNSVLLEMFSAIKLEFAKRDVSIAEVTRSQLKIGGIYFFNAQKTGAVYCQVVKIKPKTVLVEGVNQHNHSLKTGASYNVPADMLTPVDVTSLKIEEPQAPRISGDAAPISTIGDSW